MSKEEVEQAIDELIEQPARGRDFRDLQMRRVDGALLEIKTLVDEMLDKIQRERDTGNWDLEPTDLEDFINKVRTMDGMVGRLRGPGF